MTLLKRRGARMQQSLRTLKMPGKGADGSVPPKPVKGKRNKGGGMSWEQGTTCVKSVSMSREYQGKMSKRALNKQMDGEPRMAYGIVKSGLGGKNA